MGAKTEGQGVTDQLDQRSTSLNVQCNTQNQQHLRMSAFRPPTDIPGELPCTKVVGQYIQLHLLQAVERDIALVVSHRALLELQNW